LDRGRLVLPPELVAAALAPSSASLANTSASAAPDSNPALAHATTPRRNPNATAYSNTASDADANSKAYADSDAKAYTYAGTISDSQADPKRNT
jgi:hypothetical protein